MQKYSNYQETDLLWMGEVPSHWRKDKISRMVEFSASGGTPTSTNESYYDGNIKWVQTGELNDCEIFDTEKKLTEEGFKTSSTKLFPAETLLIAMYGATIGKLGILKTEATTNQACCALFFNTKKWNTKYFFYYFLNIREKLIFSSYGGGQPNISQEVIKQERLFVPPFTEQTAIAAYLDQATANIDKVIATKQKQLEKLEQYKQSKIHECVTGKHRLNLDLQDEKIKGLKSKNPGIQNISIQTKDSGIDWIGEVPGHWKTKRIKDIAHLQSGDNITSEQITAVGDFSVYGGNGLRGYYDQYTHDGFYALIGRQGALCGNINYANGKFWASEHAVVVTIFEGSDMFWLGEVLREMNLNQYSHGSAQPGLAVENIRKLKIPYPPRNEQKEISEYLKLLSDKISKEKSIIEQQIEKLKQYRKCLIHECVTGKRKVINE